MNSKFKAVSDYLEKIEPSKDFKDYEFHKEKLRLMIGEETNMWIECVRELCDRLWL